MPHITTVFINSAFEMLIEFHFGILDIHMQSAVNVEYDLQIRIVLDRCPVSTTNEIDIVYCHKHASVSVNGGIFNNYLLQ